MWPSREVKRDFQNSSYLVIKGKGYQPRNKTDYVHLDVIDFRFGPIWEEDNRGNRDGSLTPIQNGACTLVTAQLSKHDAQKSPDTHLGCDSMLLPLKYDL